MGRIIFFGLGVKVYFNEVLLRMIKNNNLKGKIMKCLSIVLLMLVVFVLVYVDNICFS